MAGYECPGDPFQGCGETFAAVDGFDFHLVRHPHSERQPDCKTTEELIAAGYGLNKWGEWFHIEGAARIGKAHSASGERSVADFDGPLGVGGAA